MVARGGHRRWGAAEPTPTNRQYWLQIYVASEGVTALGLGNGSALLLAAGSDFGLLGCVRSLDLPEPSLGKYMVSGEQHESRSSRHPPVVVLSRLSASPLVHRITPNNRPMITLTGRWTAESTSSDVDIQIHSFACRNDGKV